MTHLRAFGASRRGRSSLACPERAGILASRRAAAAIVAAVLIAAPAARQPLQLPPPRDLAPGVQLYHVIDPALADPPGPLSIWLLRVDPARATIRAALANDEVVDVETVGDTAVRHKALAAANAGFFLPNGDPAGVYTLNGRLVSDTKQQRGAVGIVRNGTTQSLLFGRLRASMSLTIHGPGGRRERVPIAGVDTTRTRGNVMLFTPAYHDDTDTAGNGLEWTLDGRPLRVVGKPRTEGKTPIPKSGFVLSFGGTTASPPLALLTPSRRVDLSTHYEPEDASQRSAWSRATDIIGGAGLLASDGRYVADWTVEAFGKGFAESRHPRTMIGVDGERAIWLVTVDGRQPSLSVGMTLIELQQLARKLHLIGALNLDGGGSTTMWAQGAVVNSPSDAAGPRRVSDALLVFPKPG